MKKGLKKCLVIGGAILVLIFIFMFVSYKSSSKCYLNSLLENTLVTNHPVLDIFEKLGPNAYNYSRVMNRNNLSIKISSLNIGKSMIPLANVSLEDSGIFQVLQSGNWWMMHSDWGIDNLSAMGSTTNSHLIWFKLRDSITSLEPGKYDLKFLIRCPICEEQVYYKNITLCVYNTTAIEDCGGTWWFHNNHNYNW